MSPVDKFLDYVKSVRRYSQQTVSTYSRVLNEFCSFIGADADVVASLNPSILRSYEVHLLDRRGLDARSVGLHLSVLSSFCRFLAKEGLLASNPVRTVSRPKQEKRLPVVYKKSSMEAYLRDTEFYVSGDAGPESYRRILGRVIISVLYGTGIRRSELISLTNGSLDRARKVLRVRGKGDKVREIPLVDSLIQELSLYLNLAQAMGLKDGSRDEPLLVTPSARALYPVFVDKAVKEELAGVEGITSRRSPHVLRHTLATELLDDGADLNSIKELLGHSSLAATQVYTHNSVEKLKKVYMGAHPLARKDK